jgi:hypothetical protein
MIVKIPGGTSSFLYKHYSQNTWTEMMKFCQVFSLSCLYRNDEVLSGILTDEVLPGILTDEVLPGILTIMFIQK